MKIFVTIFNRFSWAIPMCEKYTNCGLEVIIIDNKSTYPPCIEWLKNCGYKVEHQENNNHAWAFLTEMELYNKYKDRFFMLSDCDFDLSNVPDDFPEHLMYGLETAERGEWKSGLSFEINDFPDNPFAKQAYEHELRYWQKKNKAGFYEADVDIGVTLCDRAKRTHWWLGVRSDRPYTGRALDWYHAKETLRDEDLYYINHTQHYYSWVRKFYDEIYLK